tara:strand:+ start:502 stop:678 length:177 start_codon:yes stop_codon:yes gene_type:complete
MNENSNLIGRKVTVIAEGSFEGRRGEITSVGTGVIPIHVTLEGEAWETDFNDLEVEVD